MVEAAPKGVDLEPVTAWLAEHVPGVTPPLSARLIAGGRSNLTFRLTDAAGRDLVLRRPPLGNVLATAHDMAREHRLISALHPTPVPVPRPLGLCQDPAVNGADFYLMDYVDGLVLDTAAAAAQLPEPARREAGLDLARVAARLHEVDPDAVGLGDLARREDYVGRQLRRWKRQYDAVESREIPEVAQAYELLAQQVPPQRWTGIVHGDYRLGNVLVDRTSGQLRAVLDWELCTLGDVLADVGWMLAYYAETGDDAVVTPETPTTLAGFAARTELLETYAALTGRDLSGIAYYVGFAQWRMACIIEGVYARYRAGVMGEQPDVDVAAFGAMTRQRARAAVATLHGG